MSTPEAVTGQGLGHVRVGSDALVSRVAEVLGEHRMIVSGYDHEYPAEEGMACSCDPEVELDGWVETGDGSGGDSSTFDAVHAAHLATFLADLVQSERAAAAVEGWDEGRRATLDETGWPPGVTLRSAPNPYRSNNTTPTKEPS